MTKPMRRCGAHCRTTGQPCKSWGMANGRCRMHGGRSTGRPVTSGVNTKAAREARRMRTKSRELVSVLLALVAE
jgi:hypothetical protein